MQTCLHCGKSNPETDAYCYACGHILPSALAGLINATTKLEDVYEKLEPQRRWGTAYFNQQNRLRFSFRDKDDTLTVNVIGKVVIGRGQGKPATGAPDVDLTPFDALEKGVSRRHMALNFEHETIAVIDLGSANGTFLNGQRLLPNEPRILRDNDELRLGHMVIRVNFV
jgi:hypothetical protein